MALLLVNLLVKTSTFTSILLVSFLGETQSQEQIETTKREADETEWPTDGLQGRSPGKRQWSKRCEALTPGHARQTALKKLRQRPTLEPQ